MIKNFQDHASEELFTREFSHRIPYDILRRALRKLWALDAARSIEDLRNPPSNHLEQLQGDRKGQYSIRINAQWRICFYWVGNNVHDVEIVDYH